MGQKITPQSFRLQYLKNWNSNWTTTTSDYSKIFYLEYTFQQYLKVFCKRNHLSIHKIQFQKVDCNLKISLHFYNIRRHKTNLLTALEQYLTTYLNNYLQTLNLNQPLLAKVLLIQITFQNLKLQKLFKQQIKELSVRRLSRFKSLTKLTFMALYLQNPSLIHQYLIPILSKHKRQKQLLKNLQQLFDKHLVYFPNCLGYRVELNGRVNGRSRAKPYTIISGKTPSTTIDLNIKYHSDEVLTSLGMCNLKTFFYYQK